MMDRRSTLRRSSCLGLGSRVLSCKSKNVASQEAQDESERCEDLERGLWHLRSRSRYCTMDRLPVLGMMQSP
jgi:hypothetical protein